MSFLFELLLLRVVMRYVFRQPFANPLHFSLDRLLAFDYQPPFADLPIGVGGQQDLRASEIFQIRVLGRAVGPVGGGANGSQDESRGKRCPDL